MPKRLYEKLDNWPLGVVTALTADQLPPGASPRGRNSAFSNLAPGRALIGFRKGAEPALDAPLTDTPEVIAGFYLRRSDGTKYFLMVGDDGSLWKRNPIDGTTTLIDGSAFSESDRPGMAVANDYLFFLNGTDADAKKFDGTDLTKFGIAAPSAAPTAAAASGGSNLEAGTYDVLLTYYNSASSTESPVSASTEVEVEAGELIEVSWDAPADEQVTHVRVYLRWREAGPNFYRLITGTDPSPHATYGGFPVATTACDIDIDPDVFGDLVLLSPAVNDNYPPPTGAKSPTWHRARMFVHDKNNIYYSQIEDAENFNYLDRYEPVNPADGDEIVYIHSASDVLLIFKKFRTYALVGDDPASWRIEEISPTIGTDSPQSVVTTPMGVTYWWDHTEGPVSWSQIGEKPMPIGTPLIGPTLEPSLLNQSRFDLVVAGVDAHPLRQRIIFSVPEFGSTRNNLLMPFNYRLGAWEAEYWNPFDVASMWTADDNDGQSWLWMGGYAGHVWQWWNGNNDGLPTDAVSAGSVASSTSTTVTVVDEEGESPEWTTNELKELYVYAINQAGDDIQRRRITANTGDTLTVATAWGANPNDTYTFMIGACQFEWDTPWMHGDLPFNYKRFEYFHIEVASNNSGVEVNVDLFFTYDLLNVIKDRSFTLVGSVLYDDDGSIYDVSRYASTVLDDKRFRVGTRGRAWRARVRSITPDTTLTLQKLQMQSVLQNTRS